MARALTIQRTLVTPPDRERFHEKLKRKQAYYAKANVPLLGVRGSGPARRVLRVL